MFSLSRRGVFATPLRVVAVAIAPVSLASSGDGITGFKISIRLISCFFLENKPCTGGDAAGMGFYREPMLINWIMAPH
jgi:hypothetical protein